VFALALAASPGVAGAQDFGSVSSGERLPEASTAVPAESSNPFMTGEPGAPVASCVSPNPFMSNQDDACRELAPFEPAPDPAGAAPNPFTNTPAAPCEAPNPFMTASAAACDSSNPFAPGPGAGGGPDVAAGAAGTLPFGGSYSEAVAAAPPRLAAADRILVKKSERRLYLLHSDRVLRDYPIRLGLNPYGHKQREGDFRTPEGVYRLSRRNQHSEFFLSLEVSYPNEVDRDRARSSGVRPGGLIMIHGQPNEPRKSPDYYAGKDWTDGCIAVSNPDMVDIWLRTSIGTPIEIRP
jgi:hypothetical protein